MNKRLHFANIEKKKLVAECEAMLNKAEKRDFDETEQELYDMKMEKLKEVQATIEREEPKPISGLVSDYEWTRDPGQEAGSGSGFSFASEDGQTVRALKRGEPLCTSHFNESNPLGRQIHDLITGRGQSPAMTAGIQQENLDSAGGYTLTPSLSGYVMDLARNSTVCERAGMQVVPMPTNEVVFCRVASDPTAHWRPEATRVPSSAMGFDRVSLRAKTLACIVPLSLELLEDAPNAAQVIESSIGRALAVEMDRVALRGSGASSEPRGITNTVGINTATGVGAPNSYHNVTAAIRQIMNANYDGDVGKLAWIMSPREGATYDGLTDLQDQPLTPTPWAGALQRLYTNSLPITEGVGGDESSMIIGDFSQLILGVRGSGVNIRMIPSGTVTDGDGNSWNAVDQLLQHLVVHVRCDVVCMRPSWFTVMSGVTEPAE